MKKQYLGDSKDSFKWDYHDFLTAELGLPSFNGYILALTYVYPNQPFSRDDREGKER